MSSMTLSPSIAAIPSQSRTETRGGYARVGIATVIAAVLANVLVYFAGDAVIGYDPDFVVLGNVSGIALFTFVPAVVAVLLYGALLRRAANPARLFTVIAAVVFVVTTIPDFTYIPTVEGASNEQTAILVLTHIVAAGVVVGMLTKLAHPRGR